MSSPTPPTAEARDADTRAPELGEDIVRLVRLMTSVAEETRLVALNASLDAARAQHAAPSHAVVDGRVTELPLPVAAPPGSAEQAARVAAELLAVTTGLAMYLPGPPV